MKDTPHCLQDRADYLVTTSNGTVLLFFYATMGFGPLSVGEIKLHMRMKARADRRRERHFFISSYKRIA